MQMVERSTEHFYTNTADDTHCVPACLQMLASRLTGRRLTLSEAERLVGYEPGKLTWQFGILRTLSVDFGLHVVDHERFNPHDFLDDPEQMIRDQMGDEEAARYQIENTNIGAEVDRLRECLESGRVTFKDGAPTFSDLVSASSQDAQLMCVVNGHGLTGDEGYRPHFVIVTSATASEVVVDDPGPPDRAGWTMSSEHFQRGWLDPSETVANYIAASRKPLDL